MLLICPNWLFESGEWNRGSGNDCRGTACRALWKRQQELRSGHSMLCPYNTPLSVKNCEG